MTDAKEAVSPGTGISATGRGHRRMERLNMSGCRNVSFHDL